MAEEAAAAAAAASSLAAAPPSEAPSVVSDAATMPSQGAGAVALGSESSLANGGAGLTKSAAKRLAKRARLEAVKKDRKLADREKRKAKKEALKEEVEAAKSEGREVNPEVMAKLKKAAGTTKRQPQTPFRASVVVDLGFDELMTDPEISSMAQQVSFVYAENQKALNPFHEILLIGHGQQPGGTYATSGEPTQDAVRAGYGPGVHASTSSPEQWPSIVDTRVGRHLEVKMKATWRSWKRVQIVDHGGLEALWDPEVAAQAQATADSSGDHKGKGRAKQAEHVTRLGSIRKEDIIYLTADTTDTIEELEEGKVYIIGGIVDRNRHKELCARKAAALGIRTARLPIDPANMMDGLSMRARKVLTVNQVYEILCSWNATRDWKAALGKGLPMRKYNESERGREKEEQLKAGSEQGSGLVEVGSDSPAPTHDEVIVDEEEMYNTGR